jgi:hypothetical protein
MTRRRGGGAGGQLATASDLSSPGLDRLPLQLRAGLDRLPLMARTANGFARAISGRGGAAAPLPLEPLEGEGGGATTPDLWGRGVATLAERRAAADAAGGEGRAGLWEALEDPGEEEGAPGDSWAASPLSPPRDHAPRRRGGSFARARPPVPAGHPGSFSPSPVERGAGRAASGALVELLVSGGSPVLSPSSPASRRARSPPAPAPPAAPGPPPHAPSSSRGAAPRGLTVRWRRAAPRRAQRGAGGARRWEAPRRARPAAHPPRRPRPWSHS